MTGQARLSQGAVEACSPSIPSTLPRLRISPVYRMRMRSITARERTLCRTVHDTTARAPMTPNANSSPAPDLGRVAPPPEPAPQRPSDLQPARARHERTASLMRGAHPRLRRKERIELTPVIVDRSARHPPATDYLAADTVVRDPLADAVQVPRLTHELRPLAFPFKARLLVALPGPHAVVVMHEPQVPGLDRADRLQPQPPGEPGAICGQWRVFHAPQRPTMVTMRT